MFIFLLLRKGNVLKKAQVFSCCFLFGSTDPLPSAWMQAFCTSYTQREKKERAKEGAIPIMELEGLLEQNKTSANNVGLLFFTPFIGHSIN
jgi:hypothetical protein